MLLCERNKRLHSTAESFFGIACNYGISTEIRHIFRFEFGFGTKFRTAKQVSRKAETIANQRKEFAPVRSMNRQTDRASTIVEQQPSTTIKHKKTKTTKNH